MTCRELIGFIADYLDDSLPGEVLHEFQRHLNVCPSCIAYLDSYKKTIRLGQMALEPMDEPASGIVPEGLVKAIRAALAKSV